VSHVNLFFRRRVLLKTSVEIDEKKLKLAKKLSPQSSTLRDLVDKALDAYIAKARRESMVEILGTNFFEGNIKKMRGKARKGKT
jgi:hypothetical protein